MVVRETAACLVERDQLCYFSFFLSKSGQDILNSPGAAHLSLLVKGRCVQVAHCMLFDRTSLALRLDNMQIFLLQLLHLNFYFHLVKNLM